MIGELGSKYYLLALSAAERGDLSGAVYLAVRAISLGVEQVNARRLLGICLFELEDTENAASILAEFPDLADEARETHENTRAGLSEVERLADNGKWRAVLKAAENIPHQSIRLLNICGCILAGAKRYAKAGRLFAEAAEKDTGSRDAPEYLSVTARRVKSFWGIL